MTELQASCGPTFYFRKRFFHMLSQWCLSCCPVGPANGNNKTTVGNPALPQPQRRHFHIVLAQLIVDYPFYFRILRSVINGAIAMRIAYGRA